jgi:threonine/homoserine/homoserine lactone efflux protein
MDVTDALLAGLLSGGGVAMQFGAVSALLVETAISAGSRSGVAAGLGVATIDLAFAAVAVIAGGEARAVLAGHEPDLRAAAAVMLAVVAVRGLRSVMRAPASSDPTRAHAVCPARRYGPPAAQYVRFLALTAINPLTIAYFASVAASLSLTGFSARVAFVIGAGAASGIWHMVLTLAAGHAGRRMTLAMHRLVAIGGRLIVFGMAVQFALAAGIV